MHSYPIYKDFQQRAELFGVQAFDPSVAAFTGGALIAVSFAAGMIPAHRASRIQPLRYECGHKGHEGNEGHEGARMPSFAPSP